ncbi:MAG TPA: vWA domain-containing protein [Polyangia bacterium]|nr:vWA domain-containing protein [Polyangia bacterium]
MKKLPALVSLVALPLSLPLAVLGGCAGAHVGVMTTGEGGSTISSGSGGASATGGAVGSGGSATGTGGRLSGQGGGGGDIGPATDAGTPNCGLQQFQPTPKAADIMMVLDRSGSMQDVPDGAPSGSPSKWNIVVPALQQIVTATQSSISWGMKTFPEAYTDSMSDCAGGITSAIDVKIAAMDGTLMNSTITATTPNGSGTPTPDAVTAAAAYLKTVTDTNPKYLLLATDGEPDCVGTTKDSSSADTAAVTAVSNALTAGFPTFVIGISTSKNSANTELEALAKAGGEGIANSNPLASHYYVANDATDLVSALQAITGQISSCLFPLNPPPPVLNDPTKLGVYIGAGMTKVPYDANKSDGWAYTDSTDTAVEVYGQWCDMVQAAGAGATQIIFGCPSINVP